MQTDCDRKTDRLRSMMRAYESANHSVLAFRASGSKLESRGIPMRLDL